MKKCCLLFLFFLACGLARAEVKMPAIFGDFMVLQADAPIPVWGTSSPHEVVTVKFGEISVTGTSTASGDWRVTLPAQKASSASGTFEVSAGTRMVFKDVVVGEVWLCSGQSNMEFNLGRAHNAAEELPRANDPGLRFFLVKKGGSLTPTKEIVGRWIKCTPNTVAGFSAVAYFFAKDIRAAIGQPVGLIGSYWGGTPAQAWTSIEGLRKEPALKNYLDEHQKNLARNVAERKDFPAVRKAYDDEMARWNTDINPAYQEEMKKWAEAAKVAQSNQQPIPPRPEPSVPKPRVPQPPDGGGGGPGNLFNAMIAPLIPYAIRGVIWYQGEANAGRPIEYGTLFPALIKDWRANWQQGDFPFLFVQLARFSPPQSPGWPYLREAQFKTLSLPHTGMAVAYDVGDPTDIHPKDKLDVGKRLAAIALRSVYGREVAAGGPVYRSMEKSGKAIRISFDGVGSGLTIGTAPWVPDGLKPLPTDKLLGFSVADDKNQWSEADAKIEGDSVVVTSAAVVDPVAVRYAWATCPDANLSNKDGFPAVPFRTDNIPYDPKVAPQLGSEAP